MPTDARPHHPRRPRRTSAAGILFILTLAGCALPELSDLGQRPEDGVRPLPSGADGGRATAAQSQALHEPRYLRFRAEETQLTGVVDDGRFTFLEFASPLSPEVEFFDQDGRPLATASAGRVAAIQGLHAGLLVRRAERASFISPNPRAKSLPISPLPATPDHGEARAKLENQGGQLQAMQRAIEAAKLGPAARAAEPPIPPARTAASVQPWMQPPVQPASASLQSMQSNQPKGQPYPVETDQTSRSRQLMQLVRTLKGEALAPTAIPLAAANASAAAPDRGLVRVFFASASRAIVAPDDGLGLLLREAFNADQVRVTGYTDAIGSRSANQALAMARADAVVQILLRRGIPPERIVSSAVGAEEFIADNASDQGRALNRRAEVLLLRNGVPLAFASEPRVVR